MPVEYLRIIKVNIQFFLDLWQEFESFPDNSVSVPTSLPLINRDLYKESDVEKKEREIENCTFFFNVKVCKKMYRKYLCTCEKTLISILFN